MQDILSALPELLDEHGDNEEVRRAVVFAIWRRVAGDSLSEHASAVALDGSTLRIAVADRNWQRNLSELSKEMLFRMNFIFGSAEVKRLEFVIDKAAVATANRRVVDHAADEARALDEIDEPLRKAADTIA